MTIKSERLARELIALRLKYTASDFYDAAELIGDGAIFEPLLRSAIDVSNRVDTSSLKKKASVKRSNRINEVDLEQLKREVADVPEVREFLTRFLDRKVLQTGASLRAFADTLGCPLPKKLPTRAIIAGRLIEKLLRLSDAERRGLISQAQERNSRSSLELWSNVILRGNPGNR